GHAEIAGLVVAWIARAWFEERLAARLERSKPLPVEHGGVGAPAFVALKIRGPLKGAGEIRLPVSGPRHGARGRGRGRTVLRRYGGDERADEGERCEGQQCSGSGRGPV